MNWQNLTKQLETEWRRLEGVELDPSTPPFSRSGEELLNLAREREAQTRSLVDTAVRIYAHDGAWPALSRDEQYFLQKRLYYGWLLMDSLSPADSGAGISLIHPEGEPRSNVLEWMLIDLWPTLGVPLWLEAQAQYYSGCVASGEVL